ncbi:hypothetical protein GPJ56_008213 [Histomonas meleagridis]|uniref:uncharacterized protein n=1 Tax=Histomonas meleagridis TaxID=135588 RepID=UPI003559D4E2|nr:hypothetical protein GPJ56_008213 [Histomonas meleagridis]KAH0797234.1 hypothetical protein GO595_009916 [Histomonas meleagridis]
MFMKQSSKTPEELEKLYKIQQLIQKEMEKSQILKKENEALQSEVNKLSKIKTDLTAQKDELVNNQQSLFQEVQKQTNLNNEYNVRMNAQNEENVIFDAIVGDNKQQNCNKISEIHENNNNESKTSTLPAGCCKEESTDEKFDEDNKTETTDFSEDFDTSQIEFSDSSSSKDISENDPAESFVTIQIEIQEEATKPHKRKVKTPKKEKAPRKERKQETKSRSLSNNSKIQLVPSELNSQGIPKELFRSPYRIKIPKSRVAHE